MTSSSPGPGSLPGRFSSEGVFAQRFDSSGASPGRRVPGQLPHHLPPVLPLGQPWTAPATSSSLGPALPVRSDPRTASSHAGLRLRRRRPRAPSSQVNSYTQFQSVACRRRRWTADGDFVVAWQSYAQDGSSLGVFAQRFAGGGRRRADRRGHRHQAQSFPNKINIKSNGLVEVAILTTSVADGDAADFDAWEVDPRRPWCSDRLAATPHGSPQAEDVDGDGDLDMSLRFRIRATGLSCGARPRPRSAVRRSPAKRSKGPTRWPLTAAEPDQLPAPRALRGARLRRSAPRRARPSPASPRGT